jgi:putative NADH-flavin reductase
MTFLLFFVVYAIILSAALARAGYHSHNAPTSRAARHPPSRILIVGASGGTGRQLVSQALERGYLVTALVRNLSRLPVDHPQLTIIKGDVLDAASVEAAMRGHQAVLSALGHKRFFYPTRILSAGTRSILRAMETHGVPRLVCETSLGIGNSAGRMGLYYTLFVIPVILPFYFWDKTRQEHLIARSNVEWIIVRPGALTNGGKRTHYRYGRHVGGLLTTVRISRADVADFMLNQIASDKHVGTAPGVCW